MTVSFLHRGQKQMRKTKIRVEKVSLEELKKILPETMLNGKDNPKDKQKNKQRVAKTSKPKSKA
jgi:hypothetical protein